jgi:hypothetical protein
MEILTDFLGIWIFAVQRRDVAEQMGLVVLMVQIWIAAVAEVSKMPYSDHRDLAAVVVWEGIQ